MYYSKKSKRPALRRNLVRSTPVAKAGFSAASTRALLAERLETIGDLVDYIGKNPEWRLEHLDGLGPISAKQILRILSQHRDKLEVVYEDPPKPTAIAAEVRKQIRMGKKTPVKKKRVLTLRTPTDEAGMTRRSSNVLIDEGLTDIGEVVEFLGSDVNKARAKLLKLRNCGQHSIDDIMQIVTPFLSEPVKLLAPPVKVQPSEDEISFVEWCLHNRDWLDLVRDRMTAEAVRTTAFSDQHLGEVFD